MNKRKIMMMALALCMVAILAVGGSLAYLTDTDADKNVFTVGNVKIEQYEKDRDGNAYDDSEPKKLFPIVDDKVNDEGLHEGKNFIDKIVTVENTGSESAYIRTFIAIPAALDSGAYDFDPSANVMHWNGASATDTGVAPARTQYWDDDAAKFVDKNEWYWGINDTTDWPDKGEVWHGYQMTKGGVVYNVYIATHKTPVDAGDITAPTLMGVYFDKTLDYDADRDVYTINTTAGVADVELLTAGGTWDILVASQAVQSEGFYSTGSLAEAYNALGHAFGDPNPDFVSTGDEPAFVCPFEGTDITPWQAK